MRKFLPYQQYDAYAIEQWLNKQSMAGYRLVKMDGFFPVFKRYIDHLYHYRVRYNVIGKPPAGYKYYWGKLYIYEEQDETKLPKATHAKDSISAAQEQKKPFFALALMVALFSILESMISDFAILSPLYLACGCVATVAEVVWLAAIFMTWNRGRKIAKETIDIVNQPPTPTLKFVTLISCLVTIAAMVIVALA